MNLDKETSHNTNEAGDEKIGLVAYTNICIPCLIKVFDVHYIILGCLRFPYPRPNTSSYRNVPKFPDAR